MIYNSESHHSLYAYTINIDLNEIGIDANHKELIITQKEKAKRVCDFLSCVETLDRTIKGQPNNLEPIFILGGIYNIGSPVFLNSILVDYKKGEGYLNTKILNSKFDRIFLDERIGDVTAVGYDDGCTELVNVNELESGSNNSFNIGTFFENLRGKVTEYYTKEV
jgi:CRISPR-associated protein Cst2